MAVDDNDATMQWPPTAKWRAVMKEFWDLIEPDNRSELELLLEDMIKAYKEPDVGS